MTNVIPRLTCLALAISSLLLPFSAPALADSVAYFYALDADLAALAKAGKVQGNPKSVNGHSVAVIRVGPHEIYAVKMGSGVVRTAATAASLLTKIPCDLALSTGPAGDLTDRFKVGQWVRVSEVVAYQDGTETQTGFLAAKDAVGKIEFPKLVLPETWNALPAARVASGEIFVNSGPFRRNLGTLADAVDMNLGGLIVACTEAGVPLACWKVISDHADEHASGDFASFAKTYDGTGGRQIARIIEKLPPNPQKPGSYQNLNRLLNGDAAP